MDHIEVKYKDYIISFTEHDETWSLKTKDNLCIYRSESLKKVKENVDLIYSDRFDPFEALYITDKSVLTYDLVVIKAKATAFISEDNCYYIKFPDGKEKRVPQEHIIIDNKSNREKIRQIEKMRRRVERIRKNINEVKNSLFTELR